MCLKCLKFCKGRQVRTAEDLTEAIQEAKQAVSAGVLSVVQQSSSLDTVAKGVAVLDTYFYAFKCTKCEREFQLVGSLERARGAWG